MFSLVARLRCQRRYKERPLKHGNTLHLRAHRRQESCITGFKYRRAPWQKQQLQNLNDSVFVGFFWTQQQHNIYAYNSQVSKMESLTITILCSMPKSHFSLFSVAPLKIQIPLCYYSSWVYFIYVLFSVIDAGLIKCVHFFKKWFRFFFKVEVYKFSKLKEY